MAERTCRLCLFEATFNGLVDLHQGNDLLWAHHASMLCPETLAPSDLRRRSPMQEVAAGASAFSRQRRAEARHTIGSKASSLAAVWRCVSSPFRSTAPRSGLRKSPRVKKGDRDELYKMFRCRVAHISCDRISAIKRADKRCAMGSNRINFLHGRYRRAGRRRSAVSAESWN